MKVPKYYTQKLRIAELIDGAPVGMPLPTERELAEQFPDVADDGSAGAR